MGLLLRRSKPAEETPKSMVVSLAERAMVCLQQAAQVEQESPDLAEERAIWQPDSWLIQRIWQVLADGGAGNEALIVAGLMRERVVSARGQVLYRLAQQVTERPALADVVRRALQVARVELFGPWLPGEEARQVEDLLRYGASAALIGDLSLALACIERADQGSGIWERVFHHPEQREHLAQIVAHTGLTPLTQELVTFAIRRYEDAGAQFIHQVMMIFGPQVSTGDLPRRSLRLMQRCVETFQYATLTTLASRRLAAGVFGLAGNVSAILDQLTTIANVQIARRDSGISGDKHDPHFLRQVKRPKADPDVDFQVYTMQEAIRAMPVRRIPREERVALADRLTALAVRSDGWTAAGAAASLIELGALKYAVDVVDYIAPQDPTRSEGVITLVRSLLAFGEEALAAAQVEKALAWLNSLDRRNPERATIWGLAEVYLDAHKPDVALRLLETRITQPSFGERLRRMVGSRPNDDELRDNRLRFQALLQMQPVWDKAHQAIYDQLRQWAPRLLEGEALINFYAEGLLRPLLLHGHTQQVWPLLDEVRAALAESRGDKHTRQVQRVAAVLAQHAVPKEIAAAYPVDPAAHNGAHDGVQNGTHNGDGDAPTPATLTDPTEAHAALTRFALDLWQDDVPKGLWQTIHGIEGMLSLVLALDGPASLVLVAQMAAREGPEWDK